MIIVKFSSYRTRRKLYEARTKTRDVYINEDLTKSRSKLLLKARRMVKKNFFKVLGLVTETYGCVIYVILRTESVL